MSRKNKELARLRRELEILKSQLKYRKSSEGPRYPIADIRKNNSDEESGRALENPESKIFLATAADGPRLKKDLTRTFFLSLALFGLIFAFYFLEGRLGELAQTAASIINRIGR